MKNKYASSMRVCLPTEKWNTQGNEIDKELKTISEHEKEALENPISLDEVNSCLKATRTNVSPGVSGFLEPSIRCFGI